MGNRNEVFSKFISDNPMLANPEGHHRRLADWSYDTKYRDKVDSGEMSFQSALIASRDEALKTLPPPHEKLQTAEGLTGADRAIADMAIARNQPIPIPSGNSNDQPGIVAQTCARYGGIKTKED